MRATILKINNHEDYNYITDIEKLLINDAIHGKASQ